MLSDEKIKRLTARYTGDQPLSKCVQDDILDLLAHIASLKEELENRKDSFSMDRHIELMKYAEGLEAQLTVANAENARLRELVEVFCDWWRNGYESEENAAIEDKLYLLVVKEGFHPPKDLAPVGSGEGEEHTAPLMKGDE